VKPRRRRGRPKGDTKRQRWQEAADRLGGGFREGKRSTKDVIEFDGGTGSITVDTYVVSNGSVSVTYTRARAYARGWRGLRLVARPRSWFDRLLAWLGRGEAPPLARDLLDRFVVRGKPSSRVPSLFADRVLVDALLGDPAVRLEVKRPSRKGRREHGEGVAEVGCRATGVVTDVARLVGMVVIVEATLDALVRIGEADGSAGRT
jgi:hypothetical protein